MAVRQIVLDTETTGLYANQGDRLIEFAGLEMIDRRLTGKYLHEYVHPERDIAPEAIAVHGITLDDLADKPKFAGVAQRIADFLQDSELIIHNAAFDIGFLNMEFARLGMPETEHITGHKSIDTVAMARRLYPGQKVNLDALCNRLGVDKTKRVLHGALIDCELLAEVYLGMTRGQFSLDVKATDEEALHLQAAHQFERQAGMRFKVIDADEQEQAAHAAYVAVLDKSVGGESLYRQQMQDI
ncbi:MULTISPECIES: DNA polymerase III subunit epsilon [Vitreoscilla]|uniref:DNA polymerase III subunit epsilon n=1 Tax=Vitreoscilla stercoraria TaxID=61 RepID=A0ABY4EC37_VITST|nr:MULTISPECIES: DNA polymerase III subunit epsilon [Vitreoscilla]AUZ05766.1 subunit epsilon of DNA polymerase 3 [Vitreoscilla sp. C1]UOO92856.1 DNA polymerase III subunit epsilon [Vitreoscilla stercoraria]